jgi:hypothetical protein
MLGFRPQTFPFSISTPNTIDVWNIGFWVKKVIRYWWRNMETILN